MIKATTLLVSLALLTITAIASGYDYLWQVSYLHNVAPNTTVAITLPTLKANMPVKSEGVAASPLTDHPHIRCQIKPDLGNLKRSLAAPTLGNAMVGSCYAYYVPDHDQKVILFVSNVDDHDNLVSVAANQDREQVIQW